MTTDDADLMARMDDLIDGAGYDWTVSDDAMRWTPDRVPSPLVALGSPEQAVQLAEAMRPTMEQAQRGVHAFMEAFRPFAEAYLRNVKAVVAAMTRLYPVVREVQEAQRAEQRRVHQAYRGRQLARKRRRRG